MIFVARGRSVFLGMLALDPLEAASSCRWCGRCPLVIELSAMSKRSSTATRRSAE
jgi:hypothetical protein